MGTKPPAGDDASRWALVQSLLAAATQGLMRALVDTLLGRWGKDLF